MRWLGNGKFIIGQEQDVVGGRFSQSEAFLGTISHFDVWNTTLTAKRIDAIMNTCNDTDFGNVYSWPDIQFHINGDIMVTNNTIEW